MADDALLRDMKFGVGQPVPRTEDPRLLTGAGRYTDDLRLPGEAHGVVLRSPIAHGEVGRLDVAPAREAPGVLAVLTAADLAAAGIGALPSGIALPDRRGGETIPTPRPVLAEGRVRALGVPLAFVVAETAVQAKDAAELIELDIDPLPAVTDPLAAIEPGAPQLWDAAPRNVILDFEAGDAAAVQAAMAKAAHVTRLRLVNNRVVVAALEPRAAIGEVEAGSGRFVLRVPSQGVVPVRGIVAQTLGVPADRVRILTGDVGGSFGMKSVVFPEYILVLHAARLLGRPVRWTDDRSGSFVSDQQGRASVIEGRLALDADGRFLAYDVEVWGDMGAYAPPTGPHVAARSIARNMNTVYAHPALHLRSRCIVTNTPSIGAYRGAGRPEANFVMERLVEQAARETGRDPVTLRRLNLIPPAAMPYRTAHGVSYDSGDFPAVLEDAIAKADRAGFAARRDEAARRGRLRGIGISCYVEATAPEVKEQAGIRFEGDGTVTIVSATLSYGQGHATSFAQVLVDALGVPFEAIRLVQGDSDEMQAGGVSGGSRSMLSAGHAIRAMADRVIETGRALAGHVLEAAVTDIEFRDGRFAIAGTDRAIGVIELARRVREARGALPPELPGSLDVSEVVDGVPSAFPNGCHVAEVEVDPETGVVAVVRHTAVDDFGTVVNPLLVAGQVHGGVAQGLGQALLERTVFDGEGQLLTGSFMDYALPRADDVPEIAVAFHPVPARTNRLGAKGCGEAGVAGAMPAVMNALHDALAPLGVTHIDMPATPEAVWRAVRAAQAAR